MKTPTSPSPAHDRGLTSTPISTIVLVVGVIVGSFLLVQGLAASYEAPTPVKADTESTKPDLTIGYTINNVGYIEPCG